MVTPVSLPSLVKVDGPAILERPFLVVATATNDDTDTVATWAASLPVPILQVALGPHNGAISSAELNQTRLQHHVLEVLDALVDHFSSEPVDRLRKIVETWNEREIVAPNYDLVSHLITLPNVLSLAAGGIAGTDEPQSDERWTGRDEAAYVTEIVKSYDAVQALRDDIPFQPLHRVAPAQPDVLVVAPALYQVGWSRLASTAPTEQRSAVRNLLNGFERQAGFRRNYGTKEALRASPIAARLLRERIGELTLFAIAVGIRAASTLSAVVRVPPAVNRARGLLGQLGRLARSQQLRNRTDLEKTFASVQSHLKKAVGPDLLRCIDEAAHGVKLISDAPLEWLPIGDLPLGLAHVTSRLTSTPGDLLMGQLLDTDTISIPVEAFREILVVSSYTKDDRIGGLVQKSIEQMAPAWSRDRLNIKVVDVANVDDLVAAFNAFSGPLAIFDGHGKHEGNTNVGYLMIGETPVDIWSLRNVMRIPPIVMLSACDTQSLGGSHATAANGFLSIGARTVLGTLLPIDAVDAAVLVARMMLRIAEFAPAAIRQYGRGILWSEMVTGLLRMTVLSDLIMDLLAKNLINEEQYHRIGTYGNCLINAPDPEWLDRIKQAVIRETGMRPGELDRRVRSIIAKSDAIRYCQLGNPETIVIGDAGDVAEALLKKSPDDEDGQRLVGVTARRDAT
ncbi:CHAT domain-containing protein [Croceicoccus hydrothermalis]|uniref:CHAT domain-containing protein n=1 Tax=Croceicoccus hydrothermalis TaxID=2867964 RepID=UPI001EFAC187|nr:CHAT domain-containing protein [Croceicoccus hydrothermalis]